MLTYMKGCVGGCFSWYLTPYLWCFVALTARIQRTNEYAHFTQVVCEPVPISYQHACWMAGQMAPNEVTSCFNKTLESRVASLNANKDYYAIHFLSSPSNSPSLSVIFHLPPHPPPQPASSRFCSIHGSFMFNCVCGNACMPQWCYQNSWIQALPFP